MINLSFSPWLSRKPANASISSQGRGLTRQRLINSRGNLIGRMERMRDLGVDLDRRRPESLMPEPQNDHQS